MHYGSSAFSRFDACPTMIKKDGSTFGSQRTALSASDISGLRAMYHLD